MADRYNEGDHVLTAARCQLIARVERRLSLLRRGIVGAIRQARLVDKPALFLIRSWITKASGDYRIHGAWIELTQRSGDANVFDEVFVERFYELPAQAPTPRAVADLGGNVGFFTLFASLTWADPEVVAFEPDPANAARYRRLIDRNGINAHLIEACAGTHDGATQFAAGLEAGSHVVTDESGLSVAVVDVFPHLGAVDLIKIDIEGSEWPLLLDRRFASLSAFVVFVEYHPHLCPARNPRQTAEALLRRNGFAKVDLIFHHEYLNVGLLCATRVD